MPIQALGKTHTGSVRTENEDCIDWWFFSEGKILCCALADGMGGYEGGALASNLAVSSIRGSMTNQSFIDVPEFYEFEQYLKAAGASANDVIQARRKSEPHLSKMGTTLVVTLVYDHQMCLMHAGDSRCYIYRNDTLSQLTRDDSVVQQMIDNGSISEKDRERAPYRNVLVKAVGIDEVMDYSVSNVALKPGDLVMLCSDGLFNALTHDEITSLLALPTDLSEKVNSLIAKSLEVGATDNVSVIIFTVNKQ